MKNKIPLIFIILSAFFLRVFFVLEKVYWYDEVCSLNYTLKYIFSRPLDSIILRPFFYVLLSGWNFIFTRSDICAPILSIIFGCLSILLVYKIGCILFGERVGILAAFLFSINPLQIYYSCEVTPYSLVCFFALLSVFVFFKMLENKRYELLLLLVNVLMLLTHPISVIVILVQIIFMILTRRISGFNRYILITVLIFGAVHILTFRFMETSSLSWIQSPNWVSLWNTLTTLTYGGPSIGHSGVGYRFGEGIVFLFNIISSVFLGLLSFVLLSERKNRNIQFVFMWLVLPVVLLYLFSKLVFPIYLTRYLIMCSGAFCLLAAYGFCLFLNKSNRVIKVITIFVLTGIFVIYGLAIAQWCNIQKKPSWKYITKYINALSPGKKVLILLPFDQILPFWYYYERSDIGSRKIFYNFSSISNSDFKDDAFKQFYYRGDYFNGVNVKHSDIDKEIFFEEIKSNISNCDVWCVVSPYWDKNIPWFYVIENLKKNYVFCEKKYIEFPGVYLYRFKVGKR